MYKEAATQPINLPDYEVLAEQRMAHIPWAWDYYQGGSDDEVSLHANRVAFEQLRLCPRALVDVKTIDTRTCSLTWAILPWIRSLTSLPILLKGILTAEDAYLALSYGAAGMIVSNHGGRQLDSVVAGIEALPEVVEAVAGRCEVYVDGGIRRGTDVLKALALGARAVLLGRPILWGLAVDGESGVYHILQLLRAEFELAMALAGCPTLLNITRALLSSTLYIFCMSSQERSDL